MQVSDYMDVIENMYQMWVIIIGFTFIVGSIYYIGVLSGKRLKLYKSEVYEFKIFLIFVSMFYVTLLFFIIAIYFIYIKYELKYVNHPSLTTLSIFLAVWTFYIGLISNKLSRREEIFKNIVKVVIIVVISFGLFILIWMYYINNEVMQYIIIFILLTSFFYYIYIIGIKIGEKRIKNLADVTVITTYGEEKNLKLYQTTNTDYRFVMDNGDEIIIPRDKVIKIITKYRDKKQN